MRRASALVDAGAPAIEDVTPGGQNGDNVVPFGRSTAGPGASRERHPAGNAVPEDRPDDGDLLEDGLPSERSIAHGLAEGRRWALAASFERWADLVHGVARQMVGHDAADDVTQQVYVEAWRSRRSFAPDRGEVPGWLVGITRNVARGHLRARGPRTLEIDERLDADEQTPGADAVVDSLLVANAMRDLPPNQRAVLTLTLLGEFTQTEAAAHLDIPLGTVKTRHRRGLATLRDALQGVR